MCIDIFEHAKATIYATLTNRSVSVVSKRNSKWHPVSSMEIPRDFGAHFAMEIHSSNQSGNQVTHRMFRLWLKSCTAYI